MSPEQERQAVEREQIEKAWRGDVIAPLGITAWRWSYLGGEGSIVGGHRRVSSFLRRGRRHGKQSV